MLREQWAFNRRRQEAARRELEPLVRAAAASGAAADLDMLRRALGGLGRQGRTAAAWLVLDLAEDAEEAAKARLRAVLDEVGAIGAVEQATRRRTPWRRALACDMLGAAGDERSVPFLLERLEDSRSEVRLAAVRALGRLGAPEAAAALTALYLERRAVSIGVSHAALKGLGRPGAEAFRRGLSSPDATVRVSSCFGIADAAGELGPGAASDLLAGALADPDARVRTAAVRALGRVGGLAPPPGLLATVEDPDVRVRRETAAALGAFDWPGAAGLLAEGIADPDREVALRSAESLAALRERPQAGAAVRATLDRSDAWPVEYASTIAEVAS